MKLFLAAKAINPKSLERLTEFVGGSFKGKTITYVPTASNGEFYGAWKGGNSLQVALSLGANVNIVELESNNYRSIKSQIKGTNILWVAGGMSGYLLYWMRRCELDKAIPEILDSGTIYVGSSAGSMVCSKSQNVGEWFIGEQEPGASFIPGLGLIDFEIYPHYEDELRAQIEEKWQEGQGKLYLLRNGDVITKVGGEIKVLGEEVILDR
jgi:dipeptidase E